jgi:uncharacterized protein (TIGR02145 family)
MRLRIGASAAILLTCWACKAPEEVVVGDVDGNKYPVVRVGSQVWLGENLRVTRASTGAVLATQAPDDNPSNLAAYGRLYPWESARRACPAGWHLPSDAEWTALEKFLGDKGGRRLRDPAYWPPGLPAAGDEIPFHARPAGYSNDQGFENFFGSRAVVWTASQQDDHFVWSRVLSSDPVALRRAPQHPQYGFSVRCIRDGA